MSKSCSFLIPIHHSQGPVGSSQAFAQGVKSQPACWAGDHLPLVGSHFAPLLLTLLWRHSVRHQRWDVGKCKNIIHKSIYCSPDSHGYHCQTRYSPKLGVRLEVLKSQKKKKHKQNTVFTKVLNDQFFAFSDHLDNIFWHFSPGIEIYFNFPCEILLQT